MRTYAANMHPNIIHIASLPGQGLVSPRPNPSLPHNVDISHFKTQKQQRAGMPGAGMCLLGFHAKYVFVDVKIAKNLQEQFESPSGIRIPISLIVCGCV